MRIAGLQKLALVDYPGVMAATVFLAGCDFRCPFCHNASLVVASGGDESCGDGEGDARGNGEGAVRCDAKSAECGEAAGLSDAGFPSIDEEAFWAFLEKRRGILQGVCITGGEPLLRSGLVRFCARIKDMGYKVKLDTNGAHPERLAELLDAGLLDYVAMDVKACWSRYAEAAGLSAEVQASVVRAVQKSAHLLTEGSVPYEFRTTVVRELHDEAHLAVMADELHGAQAWYLQRYVDSPSVLAGQGVLSAYSEEEMIRIVERLRASAPFVHLRGV